MEVAKFIKLLLKRKWLIIGVPLIIVAITFYIVKNMADTYGSHARMSTGLVDKSQQILSSDGFQESRVNSDFANLMEMMRLNKVFDQITYRLIIHDLTDSVPFRPKSKLLNELNKEAINHAVSVYRKHYQVREPLNGYNQDEMGLIKLISSMDYNYDALIKNIGIFRPNNSDFIDATFDSENPNLSAFVTNTLFEEFIAYYSDFVRGNQQKTVNFLDTLLRQKESEMNRLKVLLKNYKIQNRVLNLNEQAKSLYGQLSTFETMKQLAEKDVAAFTGSLKNIEDKFNPNERKYFEATMVPINQQIAATKQYLLNLSDEYIKSNYDEKIKKKIDSAKNVATIQIQQATDRYIVNPLAAKESLIMQKVKLELDNDIAKFSLTTISDELIRLNKKFDLLVPHEAVIQNYEGAIDVASKEYLDAQFRYNKSSLESSLAISLRQIEFGIPGPASPTKKMFLVILSGLVSFILILLGLFVVFYLDDSLSATSELADKTNQVVLGYIPLLTSSVVQLKSLWEKPFDDDLRLQNFKEMLRSCRFEIASEMGKSKLLMVNSLCYGEGKTLFTMSLAYAFLMTRKRVLLIDGNFANPTISAATGTEFFLEDYLLGESQLPSFRPITEIMVMGTRGGDTSLLEISNSENIVAKLDLLKDAFDIIIIESEALSSFNKSKEWALFSEKVLTVFESGRKINYKKRQNVIYLNGLEGKFIGWVLNRDQNETLVNPKKIKKRATIFSKNIELQWA
ncbi:MAG: lipopolysaccharide biosynthesis protein [Bacteroidota bacterium]